MSHSVHALENEYWKAGILPETGASIAFGRVNSGGAWVDILRPTAPADYGNSSNCSSFIMLPWCNRIGGGRLNFGGKSHQLAVTQDDGTARHGDVRGRCFYGHRGVGDGDPHDARQPNAREHQLAVRLQGRR
ncbi:MAG: hypothetical protein IPK52_16340 [Chloroflexi bacterium]|nr:hypothetical protein [Chloroflexota bacterium]